MKFLFYIAKIYSISIIKPLAEELKRRQEDFAFYVSNKVFQKVPSEWENVYTSLQEAKKFKPDFVICPGNFVDFRIPGIKVQIFHGLGIEKESHYKIRHFFDVYMTSGPVVTERFNRLQKKYGYFCVRETGWPKIDYVINYPAENLHEKFGVPRDKKIVLYAPTFSNKMESASEILDALPTMIKENEYWILKFHELMDAAIIEKVKTIESKNIVMKNVADIAPLLHLSDVMISDTSSVVYEFMALGKPVITYKAISRKDKTINVENPGDLRQQLTAVLENPKIVMPFIEKSMGEVNPRLDGKISAGMIDTLLEIKTKQQLPKKKKPLNLFRKTQLIWHSVFRKGYLR